MKKLYLLVFYLATFISVGAQVICIDAGHGYGPNGENLDGRTFEEITTNCAVAILLEDTLTKQGYSVIMTRTTSDSGSWMSLTQRAELADNYDSERLLSIHCNGGGGTGTESFWCYRESPNRAVDSIFSMIVQEKMVFYGEWRNRRSIEDNLYLGFHLGVLKGSTHGCLNEIGFVDTPSDLEKLLNAEWRKNFATAYSEAIKESFEVDYPSEVQLPEIQAKCFPNPFSDELNLQFEDSGQEINKIVLTDITGRVLNTIETDNFTVVKTFRVNTENLPAGVYYLYFFSNAKIKTIPVLKHN